MFLSFKTCDRLLQRPAGVKRRSRAAGTGRGEGPMTTLRWGILSTANIATEKVIPGIRRAARNEVVAIASRDGATARRVADRLGDPAGPRLVRGAPGRPGRRRGLHPAPEPPPRGVDDRRRPGRQARPVREAARADRRRRGAHGRGCPPRASSSWRRSCTATTRRGSPCGSWSRSGRIGRLTAVQSWFSYYNDDPANIRNIRGRGRRRALRRRLLQREPVADAVRRPSPARVGARSRAIRRAASTSSRARILEFETGVATFTCSTRTETDQRVHVYGTRRPDLDRDPVQHPARPPDARSS